MDENKDINNNQNESEIHSSTIDENSLFDEIDSVLSDKNDDNEQPVKKEEVNQQPVVDDTQNLFDEIEEVLYRDVQQQEQNEQKEKDEKEKQFKKEREEAKQISNIPEENLDDIELKSLVELSPEEREQRKRKLKELEEKYNKQEKITKSEDGEYKRQFDFSKVLNIKKFKIKPPKKPIIISVLVSFAMIAVGLLITLLVLNRPSDPAYLKEIQLSQNTTYMQYVGEEVDLRGLRIKCIYSDGTYKYINADKSLISATSANISKENIIQSYSAQTYVDFTYNNKTTQLLITLSDIIIRNIDVNFYGQVKAGQEISFSNILLTGKTTVEKIIMLDASKAEYKLKSNNQILTKTETGVELPSGLSGDVEIIITYENPGNNQPATLTTTITVE